MSCPGATPHPQDQPETGAPVPSQLTGGRHRDKHVRRSGLARRADTGWGARRRPADVVERRPRAGRGVMRSRPREPAAVAALSVTGRLFHGSTPVPGRPPITSGTGCDGSQASPVPPGGQGCVT